MDIACLIITTIMLAPVLSKVKLLTIVDQFVIAFRLHRGVEYISKCYHPLFSLAKEFFF